mmetsp:Transcript_33107/g.44828  ORF Transcript_33107/g.44828 Transcript_33107/m.44828 type:complete len:85 (+) Transcript_33107:852-1106(+)
MPWSDLWNTVRDTVKGGGVDSRAEAQCIQAVEEFATQGGDDAWGNDFNSNWDQAVALFKGVYVKVPESFYVPGDKAPPGDGDMT